MTDSQDALTKCFEIAEQASPTALNNIMKVASGAISTKPTYSLVYGDTVLHFDKLEHAKETMKRLESKTNRTGYIFIGKPIA